MGEAEKVLSRLQQRGISVAGGWRHRLFTLVRDLLAELGFEVWIAMPR